MPDERSTMKRKFSLLGNRFLYGKRESYVVDEILSANVSMVRLWLLAVVGILAVGAVLYAVVALPKVQIAVIQRDYHATLPIKDYIELENATRSIVLQAIGGAAVFLTLYFSLRNAAVAERSAHTAREGQITDRFTKAIEQLGSDKMQMRLGGVYALERIARDSERDHWPVMEVLTAFVRDNAAWDGQPGPGQSVETLASTPKPPADIKAIMTVLKRRNWRCERSGQALDLSGTDLSRIDLSGGYLRRADFSRTRLLDALLCGADLEKADFTQSCLVGAQLDGAFIQEADFGGADLTRAGLAQAKGNAANFLNASLSAASGIGASLEAACFRGADMEGADFGGANLKHANLMRANLKGVSLHRTHLEGAKLDGTDLRGVEMRDTYQADPGRVGHAPEPKSVPAE